MNLSDALYSVDNLFSDEPNFTKLTAYFITMNSYSYLFTEDINGDWENNIDNYDNI